MTKPTPTLPSNRAFVVQFRSPTEEPQPCCPGRVEHIVSGQALHFDSWQALQAFIERTLTSVNEKSS